MSVDVQTETAIDRPLEVVAAYAADPSNAPEWYANIDSVTWETTYTWAAVGTDATRMTVRNRGEPAGFPGLVAPVMAPAMRRATART
jgi:hypothetical protein